MKTMNEKDKNEMLQSILTEGETYQCKLWGTIMADAKTFITIGALSQVVGSGAAALGALSNEYCYIGMSEKSINIVIVDSIRVDMIKDKLSIPKSSIRKVEVKKSLLPGRRVIHLYFDNAKMKISLVNNAIGSDIQNQKGNVDIFCQEMNRL